MKRVGERGQNKWEAISWDEALDLAGEQIATAVKKFGRIRIGLPVAVAEPISNGNLGYGLHGWRLQFAGFGCMPVRHAARLRVLHVGGL